MGPNRSAADPRWLGPSLGMTFAPKDMTALLRMDDDRLIARLEEISVAAAGLQVDADHFSPAFAAA
jgi:hypothetical protein